jgi:hypothetical protein
MTKPAPRPLRRVSVPGRDYQPYRVAVFPLPAWSPHGGVWALTGLAYADGVLCLGCLSHRLDRPVRLDDFPMEVPLNRESWAAIWRAVTGSDSA